MPPTTASRAHPGTPAIHCWRRSDRIPPLKRGFSSCNCGFVTTRSATRRIDRRASRALPQRLEPDAVNHPSGIRPPQAHRRPALAREPLSVRRHELIAPEKRRSRGATRHLDPRGRDVDLDPARMLELAAECRLLAAAEARPESLQSRQVATFERGLVRGE